MGRVTPPPATMEHHHIKITWALILIFGGIKQITVGRYSLVETQDESADYNQADLTTDKWVEMGLNPFTMSPLKGPCQVVTCYLTLPVVVMSSLENARFQSAQNKSKQQRTLEHKCVLRSVRMIIVLLKAKIFDDDLKDMGETSATEVE